MFDSFCMCDLYPFARLMASDRAKLPKDIYPFRNYIRGPQEWLYKDWVTFYMSWHPNEFLFSVAPHLKVWNVIQYFTALEPNMLFEATNEHGTPLDATVVLKNLRTICITRTTIKPNNNPDACPYDLPNKRSRWCQTTISMQQRTEPQRSKSSPPTPPGFQPQAQAGCMT
jgi:hypothetical protein